MARTRVLPAVSLPSKQIVHHSFEIGESERHTISVDLSLFGL
jgi:hypothetical protein